MNTDPFVDFQAQIRQPDARLNGRERCNMALCNEGDIEIEIRKGAN